MYDYYEYFFGRILINRARGCGCGTCVVTCPDSNLELIDAYFAIKPGCNICGISANICPVGALRVAHEL